MRILVDIGHPRKHVWERFKRRFGGSKVNLWSMGKHIICSKKIVARVGFDVDKFAFMW